MGKYDVVKIYGMEIDLTKEGHTACPKCRKERSGDRSGNNMMVYGQDADGMHRGGFCFACQFSIPDEYHMMENEPEVGLTEEDFVGKPLTDPSVKEFIKENTGVAKTDTYRSIRPEIANFFKTRYQHDTETNEVTASYYLVTKDDKASGYKKRAHPKTFNTPFGETGKDCDLFGKSCFPSQNKTVVICAGEIDAMSFYQVMKDKSGKYDPPAVVSPTVGEAGCIPQIKNSLNYDYLTKFQKIIVAFDNDAAGKEAAAAVCEALPRGKTFILTPRYKDINEYLVKGKQDELMTDYFGVKTYTPSGIIASADIMQMVVDNAGIPKIPFPPFLANLNKLTAGGIPVGSAPVTIAAASGSGKSLFVNSCVAYWAKTLGYNIGVLSTEASAAEYGKQLLGSYIGVNLQNFEDEEEEKKFITQDWVIEKGAELFKRESGESCIYVVDDRDSSVEAYKEQILKMILSCDCKIIVLDLLTDVMSSLDNEGQRLFNQWMKSTQLMYGVNFICASHLRKGGNGGKDASQGADVNDSSVIGSSATVQSSSMVIFLIRDKSEEDPIKRNTTVVKLAKCRHTGNTDPHAEELYYDQPKHRLVNFKDYFGTKVS